MMCPLGPLNCPDVDRGATGGNFIFSAAFSSNQPASTIPVLTYSKRAMRRASFPFLNAGSYRPGERKIDAITAAWAFVS